MQLHELVQKSGHHLRLAEAHGVVERLEVYEVGAVDAGGLAENCVSDGTAATLQGAVLDVVCKRRRRSDARCAAGSGGKGRLELGKEGWSWRGRTYD